MKKIIIHLGVHKTATTYLQNTLWKNIETLKEKNIAYISLGKMRSGITSTISNDNYDANQVREVIIKNLENYDNYNTVLMSDENILGGINDIFAHSTISPKYEIRINKIKEAFKNNKVTYFLAIRNYSQYYSSIYCEFLRHTKKYISFKNFMAKFNFLQFGWQDLVKNLLEIIDIKDLYVFKFEDFVKNDDFYFNSILNTKNLILDKHKVSTDRVSYRNKTIEFMDHLSMNFSNQVIIKLIDGLDNNLKKLDFNHKFVPWHESEIEYFAAKYQKDLGILKKMKINLI